MKIKWGLFMMGKLFSKSAWTISPALGLLLSLSSVDAATFRVSNSSGLLNAMRQARSGDVINLASGTYSNLIVRSTDRQPIRPSGTVVIQSENPTSPARFYRLELIGVSNLVLQDLHFVYSAQNSAVSSVTKPFRLEGGQNVTYRRIKFEGYYDSRNIGVGHGLNFKQSNTVVVENCQFDRHYYALQSVSDNVNLTVRNNRFTNVGHDAIQMGTTQNVLIEGNYIHMKSDPNLLHKDSIQIHNAGTGAPASNITIRGNTIYAPGAGNNSQGIYANNERASRGRSMYYRNFLIENNDISIGQAHGISIGEIDGLTVRNNRVLKDSSVTSTRGANIPTIRIQRVSLNVRVTGNTLEKAPVAAADDNAWSPLSVPSSWVFSPNTIVGR